MPTGNPTFLQMLQSQGTDGLAALASDVAPAVPEIALIAARGIRGITYWQNVRTALPEGGFRDANEGVETTRSMYERRQFNCHIANAKWMCDKAIAMAHEDGQEAYIYEEGQAILLGEFVALGKQLYYGRGAGGHAKGYPGLVDTYDAANYKVDATGTTPNTASSVWFIKNGPMGIQWLLGNDASMSLSGITEVQAYKDNKPYTALHQETLFWAGMKQAALNAACRICNITEDAGKGLTDALMGRALAKFPVGIRPDYALMSRRSLEQLRASRTATNATGAEAPTPTDYQGVPIVATDSILNTEAIVA